MQGQALKKNPQVFFDITIGGKKTIFNYHRKPRWKNRIRIIRRRSSQNS